MRRRRQHAQNCCGAALAAPPAACLLACRTGRPHMPAASCKLHIAVHLLVLPPVPHPNPRLGPQTRLNLVLQIQPDDAFGQQMMLNLESRGCPLLGVEGACSTELSGSQCLFWTARGASRGAPAVARAHGWVLAHSVCLRSPVHPTHPSHPAPLFSHAHAGGAAAPLHRLRLAPSRGLHHGPCVQVPAHLPAGPWLHGRPAGHPWCSRSTALPCHAVPVL